ncbi:MAG: type II toxin-antitoxin system RelE/ParE family toxin [Acidobacteriia bacterium]|nr:type II toxin-antitoxin system RelE/ParE family toxin [Terriglobia bacterium]
MILNFRDRASEDVYNGVNSRYARTIPRSIWKTAGRKLDMLNAAKDLHDLQAAPGNHLELLKESWAGHHSIRINNQYRIVFKWVAGNANDVVIVDYH